MKISHLHSLAWRNIKTRKKEYRSTLVGLVIAVFFISLISSFILSVPETVKQNHIALRGLVDVYARDIEVEDEVLNGLIEDNLLDEIGYIKNYAQITPEKGWLNGSLSKMDDTASRLFQRKVLQGRLPEKVDEVAIEKRILEELHIPQEIGQEINLPLSFVQANGERLNAEPINYRFILVGILENKVKNLVTNNYTLPQGNEDYGTGPGAIVAKDIGMPDNSVPMTSIFASVPESAREVWQKTESGNWLTFLEKYKLSAFQDYSYVGLPKLSLRVLSTGDSFFSLFVLCALGGSAILAVILSISNNLVNILSLRNQQIGLLRAIGAGRAELGKVYFLESLFLAAIASPIGLSIALLTYLLLVKYVTKSFVPVFRPIMIPIVLVFTFVVVLLTSLRPINQVLQLPPMQAIRNVGFSRQLKKTIRLESQALYNPSKLTAKRNVRIYKNSYVSVTIFLSLMVFLAMSVSSILLSGFYQLLQFQEDYTVWGIQDEAGFGYNLQGQRDVTANDLNAFMEVPQVNKLKVVSNYSVLVPVDYVSDYFLGDGAARGTNRFMLEEFSPSSAVYIDEEYRQSQLEKYLAVKNYMGYHKEALDLTVRAIDEESFAELAKYLTAGAINIEAVNRGEMVLMAVTPYYSSFDERRYASGYGEVPHNVRQAHIYKEDYFHVGDALQLDFLFANADDYLEAEKNREIREPNKMIEHKAKVGGLIEMSAPYLKYTYFNDGDILTTLEGAKSMGLEPDYDISGLYVDKKINDNNVEILEQRLDNLSARVAETEVWPGRMLNLSLKHDLIRYSLAAAAILLTIASMCVSLISNNMRGRIRAGHKEIGTMRAVGANKAVIEKSYSVQIYYYLRLGAAIGIILSLIGIGCLYFMHVYTDSNYLNLFSITLPSLLVGTLLVLFVYIGSRLNIRKELRSIVKKSVVENIRTLSIVILLTAGIWVPFTVTKPVELLAEGAYSPQLMLVDYHFSEDEIHPGDDFSLDLKVKNLSHARVATDVAMKIVSSEDSFIPIGLNSLYISDVDIEGIIDWKVSFRALHTANPGLYKFLLQINYSDAYGGIYSKEETVYVNLLDEVRLGRSDLQYAPILIQGENQSFDLELMNLGKSTLNNVLLTLDIPHLAEGITSYIGTIEPAKSEKANLGFVVSDKAGPDTYEGQVLLTYEDYAGIKHEEKIPISMKVEEKQILSLESSEQEEKKTVIPPIFFYVSIGIIAVLLVILFSMNTRIKKYKKELEARL